MIRGSEQALLRGTQSRSDRFQDAGESSAPAQGRETVPSSRSLVPPRELAVLGAARQARAAGLDGSASHRRTTLPSEPGGSSRFYSARLDLDLVDLRGSQRERPNVEEFSRSNSRSSLDIDTVERRGVDREAAAQEASGDEGDATDAAVARLRMQVMAHLGAMPLAEDVQDRAELQAQMEAEYVQWAADRLLERHKAYGATGGYHFREHMPPVGWQRASVAIAYESLKGFMTSATRTPSGGAISTLRDNEDGDTASKIWPAVYGGMVAGMVNYLTESIVVPAMDRRSRVANMPGFKAVDPKVLVPDPAPVQLEVTAGGAKRFWRPARDSEVGRTSTTEDVVRPTRNALRGVAFDHRKLVETRQKLMDGKAEAALLKPVLTASANATRRSLSSEETLASPLRALGFGAVASGTASAVNKALLETTKALPRTGQVAVSDLVGGTQRVNLFRLALPDDTQAPLQWRDARRLPGFAWNVAQESVPLLGEAFRTSAGAFHAARDFFVRSVGGNVVIGAVASAAGLQFASIVRGRYGVPDGDEPPNSLGGVMQQAGQSFFSELGWSGWKALMGDISGELTSRLDRRRDQTQERLWREARGEMRALDPVLGSLLSASMRSFVPPARQPTAESSDAALRRAEEGRAPVPATGGGAVRDHVAQALASLADLMRASPQGIIAHGAVASAADSLRQLTSAHGDDILHLHGVDRARLLDVQARLERVVRHLEQREALIAWREGPRPHAD
ncbi:type III secretion system effector XopF2 [Acidovorax sacchari]|uniref:type III secretion system effector XopF2 n=1 Tax=Acidovorax sacchari TaxID=3230736 RepID=UPI0039E700D2